MCLAARKINLHVPTFSNCWNNKALYLNSVIRKLKCRSKLSLNESYVTVSTNVNDLDSLRHLNVYMCECECAFVLISLLMKKIASLMVFIAK